MIGSFKLLQKLFLLKHKDYRAFIAIVLAVSCICIEAAYIVWNMYEYLTLRQPMDRIGTHLNALLIDIAIVEGALYALYRSVGKLLEGNKDVSSLLEGMNVGLPKDEDLTKLISETLTRLGLKFNLDRIGEGEYDLTIRGVDPLLINAATLLDWIAEKVTVTEDKSDENTIHLIFHTT